MLTSPTALAKLGCFLMEARQHQTRRHKDVIMISPPDQGLFHLPSQSFRVLLYCLLPVCMSTIVKSVNTTAQDL